MREKMFFFPSRYAFFLGEEYSYQEYFDKHVLRDQKRCVSEGHVALESRGDILGHLSL